MNQNDTGTISRRTVAKGAAWAVPAAVALGAAPRAAASAPCQPTFTFGGGSCKCPGGSTPQKQAYWLLICANPSGTCTPPGGNTGYVWICAVQNNSKKDYTPAGGGFPLKIPLGSCDSMSRLFTSNDGSSAQYLKFQYSYSSDCSGAQWSDPIPAPNQDCGRDDQGNCTSGSTSANLLDKKADKSTPASSSTTAPSPSGSSSAPAPTTQAPSPAAPSSTATAADPSAAG